MKETTDLYHLQRPYPFKSGSRRKWEAELIIIVRVEVMDMATGAHQQAQFFFKFPMSFIH